MRRVCSPSARRDPLASLEENGPAGLPVRFLEEQKASPKALFESDDLKPNLWTRQVQGGIVFPVLWLVVLALALAPQLCAQAGAETPQASAQLPQAGPIAIVPIDDKNPDTAAKVTGSLTVTQGKAVIGASGTVTSGSRTTLVVLPHRGLLRVCALSSVKLAADLSVPPGQVPGLMMAMERGAIELSFAASFAGGRNADVILTPDFRIVVGGPGAADVKVRLGPHGDTCVDNAGAPGDGTLSPGWNAAQNAPDLLISSVFDGGDYRVHPGQRVMFEQGSLREVVDNEKEPCGCPPAPQGGNEFPLAQSEGLAPMARPAPGAASPSSTPVEPLVYQGGELAPTPAVEAASAAGAPATAPATAPAVKPWFQKKTSFFGRMGRFFRRLFGGK